MVAKGAVLVPRLGAGAGVRPGRTRPWRSELRRGYTAMLPLWLGAVPFGVTYGVLAQQAGFGAIEAQLSSMLIYAGAAQMAMISLFDDGAAVVAIVLTTFVLNLRHILYGLSLSRELGMGRVRPRRPILATVLTDESYGIALADGQKGDPARRADAFLFGASISLYTPFALSTLTGVALGGVLPDAEKLGLELVFPLSFAVLLLPLLRTWRAVGVALVAAALVLAAGRVFGGGVAPLIATVGGAGLGAMLDGRTKRQ